MGKIDKEFLILENSCERIPSKKHSTHRCFDMHEERTPKTKASRSGAGIKHKRRYENLNYLLSLTKDEDCDLDTVSLATDIVEPHDTSFSQLFSEEHKMQVWNEFISRSEDEQHEMLYGSTDINDEIDNDDVVDSDYGSDRNGCDSDGSWEQVTDSRTIHPAYSAKECFNRINHNIRDLLNKKHIPLGLLQNLENDIVEYFTSFPQSVYISCLSTGYERILLHAVCQYLQLHSRSYSDQKGKRFTQVENLSKDFITPSIMLTSYLQQKSSSVSACDH